jgi:hypothetical protein
MRRSTTDCNCGGTSGKEIENEHGRKARREEEAFKPRRAR